MEWHLERAERKTRPTYNSILTENSFQNWRWNKVVFRQVKAKDLLLRHKRIPFPKEDKIILNLYIIYMYSKFTASIYKAKADTTNRRKTHPQSQLAMLTHLSE